MNRKNWIRIALLVIVVLLIVGWMSRGEDRIDMDFAESQDDEVDVNLDEVEENESEASTSSDLTYTGHTLPSPNSGDFTYAQEAPSGPAKSYYEGSVVVSGSYEYYRNPPMGLATWFLFKVNEQSMEKLPSIYEPNPYFMLRGEESDLLSVFELPEDSCEAEGYAVIEIEDYHLLRAEIGGHSSAELTEIIEHVPVRSTASCPD